MNETWQSLLNKWKDSSSLRLHLKTTTMHSEESRKDEIKAEDFEESKNPKR